jgi:Helix-turn-helix.
MTIGERIKAIREFRKMTQRELGIAIGYDDKTARARISQYEINYRIPKDETLILIADALNISVSTIQNYSLASSTEIMKYLFWLDEKMERKGVYLYQIEAHKISIQINAAVNDKPKIGINLDYAELDKHLHEWFLHKEQLANSEISEQDYFEWIISYPHE